MPVLDMRESDAGDRIRLKRERLILGQLFGVKALTDGNPSTLQRAGMTHRQYGSSPAMPVLAPLDRRSTPGGIVAIRAIIHFASGGSMITIENDATARAALAGDYNLFAGAGFSGSAKNATGSNLPRGAEFKDELTEQYRRLGGNAKLFESIELPQASQIFESRHPDELRSLADTAFTVKDFEAEYDALLACPPRSILTTNVDDLFECVFSGSKSHYLVDQREEGAVVGGREAIDLVHLHGSVRESNLPLVFSAIDLASVSATDPDVHHVLRDTIRKRPTFYIGYALRDASPLAALRTDRTRLREPKPAWILLHPDEDSETSRALANAHGLQYMVGTTLDFLEWMQQVADQSSTRPTSNSNAADSGVPGPKEVRARPIADFYRGDAPTWSDAYSPLVPKTTQFARILEIAHSGKSIVVTGVPGCGKTTLLMQVATAGDFGKPKYWRTDLRSEEAGLLARQIGDSRGVLFLDNVASDIRSVEVLAPCKNLQIVAADRDFSVNSVGDRVRKLGINITGITEIDEQSRSRIWSSIPPEIRNPRMRIPSGHWGSSPSIYEFVRQNIKVPSLGFAISAYVDDIDDEDPALAELIVAAAYLSYARSEATMDIALAYFRGTDVNYQQIYEMIDSVGKLLLDRYHSEESQDHFALRSALASREILLHCSPELLRTVLNRFHESVSPLRVPNFRVFARRAYDAQIVKRAFPNADDGLEFYTRAITREPNAFVAQQRALYLVEIGDHVQALNQIELARSLAAGRSGRGVNWTIEHSFAKILFSANLPDATKDPQALRYCDEALDLLEKAFNRDSRKGQHAIAFGRAAVEMIDSLPRNARTKLIQRATDLLERAVSDEPYLDEPKFLLRELSGRSGGR